MLGSKKCFGKLDKDNLITIWKKLWKQQNNFLQWIQDCLKVNRNINGKPKPADKVPIATSYGIVPNINYVTRKAT